MPKTLKIKRVFAWSIYNNLRNTPPKDYPTTGEIKNTISVVMPGLREHITTYVEMAKEASDLQDKLINKEITSDEVNSKTDEINKKFREYNKEHAQDVIEVSFDDDAFKTFKDQFERDNWGKRWVANIEEFGELIESFAEAAK